MLRGIKAGKHTGERDERVQHELTSLFGSQASEGGTIMHNTRKDCLVSLLVVAALWLAGPRVHADVVTDWSTTAGEIAVAGKLPPGGAYRAVAVVQTAVYEAVNAITKRYPSARGPLEAAPGASVEAAVAAANRATLSALAPVQQATIDKAYQAALATLPDGLAKTAGIAVGEQAATAILALCASDGFDTPESYRPYTTPGVYVPTVLPDSRALAQAQALAAGKGGPVPPRTAAEPHQRRVGTRLQ